MPVVAVRIPQLGEGLQEARLIEFLKQPGDTVKRDEFIYVMETDKATTEVESPYDGRLVEWTVPTDAVLPIGAAIGKMEVAEGTKEMAAGHGPAPQRETGPAPATVRSSAPLPEPMEPVPPSIPEPDRVPTGHAGRGPVRAKGGVRIPPRTRRYLKDRNLLEISGHMTAAGTKLMPDDVDRFIAEGGPERIAAEAAAEAARRNEYVERVLPTAQQTLNYRMARGAQVALSAVLETDVDWTAIQRARDSVRDSGGPTSFAMLLWCVAQAMKQHGLFRSTLSNDGKTLRTYENVNLGVAVSLPEDRLLTAVVPKADQLEREEFFKRLAERVEEARKGKDQVDAATTVTVSNIGTAGMRMGIPVVVTPAVATIALGAVRDQPVPRDDGFRFQKVATLTMAFDHRLMNGIGAANFLNTIRELAANFELANAPIL